MRILLADDDRDILESLGIALRRAGYAVLTAENGRRAWELFQTERPDFVVLDVAMPGIDGFELTRRIVEAEQPHVPVILLTGHDDEGDKVAALDSGADDYVVKPCTPRELIARIRTVQRRASPHARTITAGRLSINAATHQFCIDEQPVNVTGTEFALLLTLMKRSGQVVRTRAVMERVWGHVVSDDLLRVTIYRLRHKIEHDPARPAYIITVPGVGFMVRDSSGAP